MKPFAQSGFFLFGDAVALEMGADDRQRIFSVTHAPGQNAVFTADETDGNAVAHERQAAADHDAFRLADVVAQTVDNPLSFCGKARGFLQAEDVGVEQTQQLGRIPHAVGAVLVLPAAAVEGGNTERLHAVLGRFSAGEVQRTVIQTEPRHGQNADKRQQQSFEVDDEPQQQEAQIGYQRQRHQQSRLGQFRRQSRMQPRGSTYRPKRQYGADVGAGQQCDNQSFHSSLRASFSVFSCGASGATAGIRKACRPSGRNGPRRRPFVPERKSIQ